MHLDAGFGDIDSLFDNVFSNAATLQSAAQEPFPVDFEATPSQGVVRVYNSNSEL